MASRDEIYRDARKLSEAVRFGEVAEEELSDKGRLFLQLGRGEIGFQHLSDPEIDLIGLDRPLLQRAGRAIAGAARGALGAVGGPVGPPQRTGLPAEEFVAATREAATGPGMAETVRQEMGGVPSGADLFLRMLSGPERVMQTIFSPLAGAGAVAEQVVEQVPRLAGQEPASTRVSRATGLATEMLPPFGPAARARPLYDPRRGVPSTGGYLEPRVPEIVEPPRALPPGQPFERLPPERATRRQLPAAPSRRELPPVRAGTREEVLAETGPPGLAVPEHRALPPAERVPKAITGRVVGQPIPLPAERTPPYRLRALPAAGATTGAPSLPLAEGPEAGVMRLTREPVPPPLPPEPPPPARPVTRPAPPPAVAPAGIVPPPGVNLPPSGVVPPTRRPAKPRSTTGGGRGVVDVGTVNLDDPDEVLTLVRGFGGIKFGTGMKGEAEGVPFHLRNERSGIAYDELIDMVAKAQSKRHREVENRLMRTLDRYKSRRGVERASGVDEIVRANTPPDWVAVSKEEWKGMGPAERKGLVRFMQELREHGDEGPEGGGFLGGAIPPIPVPGPDEDERETLSGWAQRAAQVLGLAAPILAMAVSRRRSTRKQTGQPKGPGGQGMIPGTPSPEVPKTPLRTERPQADITETPLFGQERAARERKLEEGQGKLFGAGAVVAPPAILAAATPAEAEHEQSVTVERDGRFYNVYGPGTPQAGQPLPLLHPWEKESYDTEAEAIAADVRRSAATPPTVVPPPATLPPMEQEIDTEIERLRQQKEGEQLPWGPQTPEARAPVLVAGLFPRFRPPRGPRAPEVPPPQRTVPEVPPEFRRERIRPVEPERPFTPPPGVVEPPTVPPRPPTGRPEPGPLPELPDSALGRAWRGGVQGVEDVRAFGRWYFSPLLSRFEQMGAAGQDLSRTVQQAESAKARWYGQHVDPVVQELQGLSRAEKANFREVAEGGAQPMNARVRRAYAEYLELMGPEGLIPREAQARDLIVLAPGEQARPFRPRQAFFPHEYSPEFVREVIRPGSRARQRAIDHLLNTGQATDAEQAAVMLDDYFGAKYTTIGGRLHILEPDRFVGGLERAREINLPGYITDPAAAVAIRGWKASRRFAELDHYGRLDATVGSPGGFLDPHTQQRVPTHGVIGRIQQERGYLEAVKAFELFQQVLGHAPESAALQRLARAATAWEAFTKLPWAVIANASQPTLLAIRTDIATAAQGLTRTMRPGGSQAARELGTIAEMAMREFYDEVAGVPKPGRVSRVVLAPYNTVEIWNRAVGSNAGRVWADKLERVVGGARRPRTEAWLRRELDRLAFSPDEVQAILRERRLTPEAKERIAWAIADQTQYLARRARRSEFFNTAVGRVLGQFKQFAINTGRLVNQAVIQEARAGNWAPAARMAILFPLVGEVVEDLRSLVRGTERPDSLAARVFENFFAVGGLGVATDYVQNLARAGARGTLDFFAGPFMADVAKLAERAWNTAAALVGDDEVRVTRELQETGRFAVRQVPYVGPPLSEALRTDPKAEARARQTWQQRLRVDPADRALREVESVSRRAKAVQREADRLAAEGYVDEALALLERFNARHGTRVRLSREAVHRRQRQERAPEAARRRAVAPGARGLLRELEAIPSLPE
jgi:hypothetical protein